VPNILHHTNQITSAWPAFDGTGTEDEALISTADDKEAAATTDCLATGTVLPVGWIWFEISQDQMNKSQQSKMSTHPIAC
jgi:hypothetical protein